MGKCFLLNIAVIDSLQSEIMVRFSSERLDAQLERLVNSLELDGAFVSSHYAVDAVNDDGQRFVELYRQQYNVFPDDEAALTYDVFHLLFQALQSQGKIDPESIQFGFQQIQNLQGRLV